jgi:golgi-specific brefeldin A-resistance guanine nucleotide exchange factor 1
LTHCLSFYSSPSRLIGYTQALCFHRTSERRLFAIKFFISCYRIASYNLCPVWRNFGRLVEPVARQGEESLGLLTAFCLPASQPIFFVQVQVRIGVPLNATCGRLRRLCSLLNTSRQIVTSATGVRPEDCVFSPLDLLCRTNSEGRLSTKATATPSVTLSKMSDDLLPEPDLTIQEEANTHAEDEPQQDSPPISNFPDPPANLTYQDTISITINPVALITTECIAITSAMRKHSRWAQSSVSAILGGGGRRLQNGDSSRALPNSRVGSLSAGPSVTRSGSVTVNGGGTPTLANRWGLRGQKGKSMQDNPLLSAFGQLRSDLAGCKDIKTFDSPSLLHPFLQVIRSSSASAPITSLAISSITRFFSYNLITINSPRISVAMQLLSAAITNCRFEASDSAAEEIVLLRILKLMETMVCRPEGRLLGDGSVCELMSTCLEICCQARLSEVLRRAAEITMINMCQVIFSKLKGLNIEPLPTRSRSNTIATTQATEEMKMQPSVDGDAVAANIAPTSNHAMGRDSLDQDTSGEVSHLSTVPAGSTKDVDGEDDEVKPYSLPSIKELFRALVDLLDPHNRKHTDTMRYMALRVIDVIFEVAGPSVADQPTLAKLAKDDLCRYLLQLVRSENMFLLNGSLRVAGTLLATCRKVLKLQQEMFLSYLIGCLHSRVDIPTEPGIDPTLYEGIPHAPKLVKPAPSQPSSGRSTPVPVKDRRTLGLEGGTRKPEAREAMVESIGNLIRIPSYMVELFVNYDCEVDREDLCEDMVALLSRNAFPDSATWSTTNVPPLCLDSLLTHAQFIADRLSLPHADNSEELLKLRERRSRKKIIVKGVARFNEEPKAGIAYLVTQGIISSPDDHGQVARFLKGTTRVSKKVLGDFLSKKANEGLLKAFIGLFDFHHKRLDEALRELLSTFRLPGESQLIERIVEAFTEKFCSDNGSADIADKDAAYTLTYATIMLNTDQYNPNIKPQNRMTSDAFARNLRGVNHGNDFAREYLQEIYDSIKQEEIILPDEHDNKHAFEYAWKELLLKTGAAGDLSIQETNAFDADMFAATWRPIVATLSYVFMSATDDAVQSRVVDGFHQCAQIAAQYKVTEAFDRIVFVLSSITTLASEKPPNTSLNTEVQVDQKSVIVSELAVRYGREYKPQLATVLLFRILNGHEDAIHESWVHIIRILRNLFVNSLITFSGQETGGNLELPPIPLQIPSQVIDREERTSDSGIFSAFTSYISSYAADDPPDPSPEELENTLCTVDCIKACSSDRILSNIFSLPTESVQLVVTALLSQLPEEPSPIVVVKAERPTSTPSHPDVTRSSRSNAAYNPSTVFLLEFATILTLRDKDTVDAAGESLTASLQTAIRDASNLHPLTTSRMVHYLLDLLRLAFVSHPAHHHYCMTNSDRNTISCVRLSCCMQYPALMILPLTTPLPPL